MPAEELTRTATPLDAGNPDATLAADADSQLEGPPQSVGRYAILGELARGGMGVVHRAHDAQFDREVAVKVLAHRYADRPDYARRFLDEARITGQLQHPGIPPVHEVGTQPEGRPYLAMKLIKGRTLDDLLKARPDATADAGRMLAAFEDICQAVGYAHAHGVIHRDLKPANVMVGGFGEVQVMDWGLAKLLTSLDTAREAETDALTEIRTLRDSDSSVTRAGSVLGTPAYIPPEQASGELDRIDRRSDVFGLGAILCVVLTGKPPFEGIDSISTLLAAVRGDTITAFSRLNDCAA